ncbi:retention module-containing protein, partial [Pseudoalteromonas sp. 0303]
MDANQLLVIDVQGSAGLVQADGSIKALTVGDVITVGDTVFTADNSTILIDVQGESLAIPANKSVTITPDLLAKETQDNSENTLFDDSIDEAIVSLNQPNQPTPEQQTGTDISDFLDALEGGGDILDNLEATAAGGGGGAASGGGTSFVELARIAEGIDPSSLTFDDSFNTDNTGTFSPRDTTDGVVPSDELIATLSVNELGLTNNPQPVISGTSENLVGQTVTVTVTDANGNTQVVTVVVQPDGTFVTPPLDPLPDGPINVDVLVLDPNGDPVSDNIGASIDTVAPVVTIDTLTDSAIQNAVITGTVSGISSGDTVTITVTDSAGQVQVIATQVDDQGNWSITTEALAEGLYTVVASAVDEAGNEGSDNENGLVDLTAPVISIDTIGETNDTTPTISGTVSGVTVGSEIIVVITGADNTVQTLTAIVAEDGSWVVDAPEVLVEGEFTVTATAVDIAGNEAQATATGVIDNTAPVINITPIDDTQDTTPNISGNVVGVQQGTLVTVVVTDINGQVQTLTTVTDADGNWSLDVVADLAEGVFDVSASVTDAAGNTAQADTQGVVDLTAPDITLTAIANTNDTTPSITGRVDGVPEGTEVTVQVVDSNGQSQTLTALVLADGSYSVDAISPLPEGSFTATAIVSDAAGNQAQDTTTGIIDLTAPVISLDNLGSSADNTPTISGTVQGVAVGTPVTLVVTDANGNSQTFTAITNNNGVFSADVPVSLADGQYSVTATVSDLAGNQASDTETGTVDSSSLTILIDALGETNDTTPSISGSTLNATAGDVVTVVIVPSSGLSQTFTTTVDANGDWSINVSDELAEGEFTIDATVTDQFGNTANDSITAVVDTTAPLISIDTIGAINDSTPLISGSSQGATAGNTVTVTVVDSQNNSQTYTTTVDANGNWVVPVTGSVSQGEFTVTASITDNAGNIGTDTEVGTFDGINPLLTLDFDPLTNDSTPLITGTTDVTAGSIVTVNVTDSDGVVQTLSAVVAADGSWSISPNTPLAEGAFTVIASVEGESGNQTQITQNGVVDLTAPIITIDNLGTVNDTTPTISGQTNEPAGSIVTVVVSDGINSYEFSATVNADGSWSGDVPAELEDGNINVTASITDAAGNQAQTTGTFILNSAAPSIAIDAINETNDITPTLSGTSDAPNGTVITIIVEDSNSNSQQFTTTVQNGQWSVEIQQALSEGTFTVNASVTVDGFTSDATAQGVIDVTAPTVSIDALVDSNDVTPIITGQTSGLAAGSVVTLTITDSAGAVQTASVVISQDGSWSAEVSNALAEGQYSVLAEVVDNAGNEASDSQLGIIDLSAPTISIDAIADTNDVTPTLTGQTTGVPQGTQVTLLITDSLGNTQTLTTTTLADGSWSVDAEVIIAEGSFTVEASVSDVAGNSATTSATGNIDTTVPSVLIDPQNTTNDTTPVFSGQSSGVPAGTEVRLTVTDSVGNIQTLIAITSADGSWSIVATEVLAEGNYTIEAEVSDDAGNTGTDSATGEIDITAPTITLDTLADSNDVTPLISGQTSGAAVGSLVLLTITDSAGNVQSATATVQADGSWSVEPSTALAEGDYTVVATVSDAAGNEGSDTETGTIDVTAPTMTIDAPALTNDNTPTVTGTSDLANTSLAVTFTDANGTSHTVTVTTDALGNWSAEA